MAKGGIQSLERASAILDAVAGAGPDGIGLSDLAGQVGLHTSTAFHLIGTLETLGLLARHGEGKRYFIGPRLFTLAAGALDEVALLREGQPVLEALSRETGEAAHLAIRSGAQIVLVAQTQATGMLQMSERAGAVRPTHATAIGKLLLSRCDAAELPGLLARLDLTRFTERTITDADALADEIAAIRDTRIAHDRQELDNDVRCIAVAVEDFAGRCLAAIGISGPVWRMQGDALKDKITALRAAAAVLSGRMGAHAQTFAKLSSG